MSFCLRAEAFYLLSVLFKQFVIESVENSDPAMKAVFFFSYNNFVFRGAVEFFFLSFSLPHSSSH